MKKSLILILLFTLNQIACKRASEQSSMESLSTNMTYSQLPKYEHKWIEYKTQNGIKTNETELYISEQRDTLIFQNKVFENGLIDTTRSTFVDFEAKWINDSTISGGLTLFSQNDFLIQSKLIERELKVKFIQTIDEKRKAVEFVSHNSNHVNFSFQNDSDSLIGVLIDNRQYDTLINGVESVRFIETQYPLDNKSITNNIFIHVHKLNKI